MTRELLNTLYVQNPLAYLRLDGETIKVEAEGKKLIQVPLHHLGSIMIFGSIGVTPALIARCAAEDRNLVFFDRNGRFQARVVGPVSGNVLLREAQYQAQTDTAHCLEIARNVVAGKIRNQRHVIARAARDTKDIESQDRLRGAVESLAELLLALPSSSELDGVRGIEGQAASLYFDVLAEMITVPGSEFAFRNRTRRPPRDRVNAVLSFLYALLTADCTAACEGVGLDPQFGYLHALRPGRPALALDLMEEFRPIVADRLALTLINRRQLRPEHFEVREEAGESVLLGEDGRKVVIRAYQERKLEEVVHPFLKDKVAMGLLPHLQARLLARHLRGDLPAYLPFTTTG